MGGLGYWYYTDTQNRLDQLRENNAKLESANASNVETINQMQQERKIIQAAMDKLAAEAEASRAKVDALRDKFIDHDLTKLSVAKPGLIEKRINNGTQKVFDDLRSLTAQ